MKKLTLIAAALAATMAFSTAAYAGEWEIISGRKYFNTGYDWNYNGWMWLIKPGSPCYCYYFENGFALTNTRTPDGYYVDSEGVWVENGKRMTKPVDFATMGRETDYIKFGGNYYVSQLQYSGGASDYYNPNEFPVRIDSDRDGFNLVWTGSDGSSQRFYSANSEYSFRCDDTTLIDVIDEDNFRVLWPDGAIYYMTR